VSSFLNELGFEICIKSFDFRRDIEANGFDFFSRGLVVEVIDVNGEGETEEHKELESGAWENFTVPKETIRVNFCDVDRFPNFLFSRSRGEITSDSLLGEETRGEKLSSATRAEKGGEKRGWERELLELSMELNSNFNCVGKRDTEAFL
jgi:hypothetical protein